MQSIAVFLPSYHFGQLNLWAVGSVADFPLSSVLALIAFTLGFFGLAARAYRRMAA
jgi:hypothetical protein